MANTISPNMNLTIPGIGTEYSPNWANDLNSSLTAIDSHNHSSGQGVQINPNGLNINTPLPFNNQQATNVQAIVFNDQSSLATTNALYTVGGELFYNDTSNPVQITLGGAVNATSSGISDGMGNSAAFSGGVLVVQNTSTAPHNVQCGSILLGNNGIPSSGFVTLSPPTSTTTYALVLPTIPAQTNVMTLDNSGNMGTATYDAVGQGMTSVGANAIAAAETRSTGSTVGIGGVAISTFGCGNFSTGLTTPQPVTNLTVTITTSGRPVWVGLISDGANSLFGVAVVPNSATVIASAFILRDATPIFSYGISSRIFPQVTENSMFVPSSSIQGIDIVGAGTYTYTVDIASGTTTYSAYLQFAKLVAYEL